MSDRSGELIGAKYRLVSLLGSGGMGDVYHAVNESVGRDVAIKLMREDVASDPALVERFLREAKVANRIRHPNVCDILDSGRDEASVPYLVAELLTGATLAAHLATRGKLPPREAVSLILPAIDAIAEAHARGITHRDLKPENIFLTGDPAHLVPKIIDFGISKTASSDNAHTAAGVMLGTPAYMPPEQIQSARDADCRSDVWSLGVILFEMLTADMPFRANDAASLFFKIASQDAPLVSTLDPTLSPAISMIIARCLRREPGDRYPSAAELTRDLRNFLEERAPESTQRRRAVAKANPPPGIGLSPVAVVSTAPRRASDQPRTGAGRADMSGFVGLGVVPVISIAVLGVLYLVMHRSSGWPLATFFGAEPPLSTAVQALSAFAISTIALTYVRRGGRQWRGDWAGGHVGAGISAAAAGALLFAAVELVYPLG